MIREILIPTDFSKSAFYAAEVAVSMAELYEADLFFYAHIDEYDLMQNDVNLDYFKEKLNEFVGQFDCSHLKVSTQLGLGKFLPSINDYIKEKGIDLLVIGANGVSGSTNSTIGSTAVKLMRRVDCPTLIVKDRVQNLNLNKVVFVSNFDIENFKPYKELIHMLLPFNSDLHLLRVETPTLFRELDLILNPALEVFQKYAEAKGFNCNSYRKNHMLIEQGVNVFIEKVDPDLIVIPTHVRSSLQRIFISSVAEALIRTVGIPTMTIKI